MPSRATRSTSSGGYDDTTTREAQPQDFVPRHVYGSYVESLLETAAEYPRTPGSSVDEDSVVDIERRDDRFVVRLSGGRERRRPRRDPGDGLASRHRLGAGRPGGDRLVADPWTEDAARR